MTRVVSYLELCLRSDSRELYLGSYEDAVEVLVLSPWDSEWMCESHTFLGVDGQSTELSCQFGRRGG